MTMKPVGAERFSLSRWSRRKLASTLEKTTPAASSAVTGPVAPPAAGVASAELPTVESLTFDSDFTAFLKPGVDPAVKQAALKKLLRDPRFNVMDGLDVYIDDYSKADPIPPDMLADLLDRFQRSTAPSAAETEVARDESALAREAPPVVASGSATRAETESVSKPARAEASPRLADASSAAADAPAAPQSIRAEPLPARESSASGQNEDR